MNDTDKAKDGITEPVGRKGPREISVNLRQTSSEKAGWWVVIERGTQLLSALLIPFVLVWVGFGVNARLQDQTAKREYVMLAVSILQQTDQDKVLPEMRQWAARLLDENSPTKLPPELRRRLGIGDATLPRGNSVSVAITMSPGEIRLGGTARLTWSSTDATTVAITPDIGPVQPFGSIDVSPKETTTYTVTGKNSAGGFGSASATVRVTGAAGGKAP